MKIFIWLLLFVTPSFALEISEVVGLWQLPKNKGGLVPVARVYEHQGKIYGVGFAFTNLQEYTKKDVKNKNKKLRERLMKDALIIYNIEINGDALINGNIYNPENGKTYYLKGKLSQDKQEIIWKATIDKAGIMGPSIRWKKIENVDDYKRFEHTSARLIEIINLAQ